MFPAAFVRNKSSAAVTPGLCILRPPMFGVVCTGVEVLVRYTEWERPLGLEHERVLVDRG